MLIVSCAVSKSVAEDAVPEMDEAFITHGTASKHLVSFNKADSTESRVNYDFYTNPKLPYQEVVNERISGYVMEVLGYSSEDQSTKAMLNSAFFTSALNAFAANYDSEMSMYDSEDEYFGATWQNDVTISISEKISDYVQLSLGYWTYTGGAHGSAWSEDVLFDKKTGQQLLLADFISDVSPLTTIAEEIFRKDQELTENVDLEEAGFWFENGTFQLNENFSFNSESLDFMYNQYEIAPYAAGMIIVSIPLDKIKHLLKRSVH